MLERPPLFKPGQKVKASRHLRTHVGTKKYEEDEYVPAGTIGTVMNIGNDAELRYTYNVWFDVPGEKMSVQYSAYASDIEPA
jgi:hypothetical protein